MKYEVVEELVEMGFNRNGAARAAKATEAVSTEVAMEWVLTHMEDPDFELPIEDDTSKGEEDDTSSPSFDPSSLTALTDMGFSGPQSDLALFKTKGSLNEAVDWLFSHTDSLEELLEAHQAEKNTPPGIPKSTGIPEPTGIPDGSPGGGSKYELLGFISHIGRNAHCGHYVAHVKKDRQWYKYDDAKVFISKNPPKSFGYLYFYSRKGGV